MTDRPRGPHAAGEVAEHPGARARRKWLARAGAVVRGAAKPPGGDKPRVMTVGELASARGLAAAPGEVDLVKRREPPQGATTSPVEPRRPPKPAGDEHPPAPAEEGVPLRRPSAELHTRRVVDEPVAGPGWRSSSAVPGERVSGVGEEVVGRLSGESSGPSAASRPVPGEGVVRPGQRSSGPVPAEEVAPRPEVDEPMAGPGRQASGPAPVAGLPWTGQHPEAELPSPARPVGPQPPPVDRTLPADRLPRGPSSSRQPTRFSVPARPPVVDEQAILGLTRRSRGRIGSRVFALFFVFVYAVIALQLIVVLFGPGP